MPSSPFARRSTARLLAGGVVTSLAALPLTASAVPTCPTPGTEAACGGRVVAEATQSATFVQYGLEFPNALAAIERIAPMIVDVTTLDQLTGDSSHVSAGGRQIFVVRITDESVPRDRKKQVVASLSIHGNESAGREGGLRYAEDLARRWQDEPDATVHAGDVDRPLRDVLAEVELYLGFTNPDGWAMGDALDTEHAIFNRANSHGVDLNRQFPTTGWTKLSGRPAPVTEPEARGWVAFVETLPNLTTATDIHGELTSATDSFADLMWPAGQWSPRRQAQELQLAEHVARSVERYFEDEGVLLDTLTPDGAPGPAGTKPATFATAYDIVGYDDSGFLGDYFVSEGAVEIDVENLFSHLVPSNIWNQPLEQAHVAAVRGVLEAVMVEATLTGDVEPSLDLGRIAYLDDPDVVSSTDANGFGFDPSVAPQPPEHYEADRLRYFEDLRADAGEGAVVDEVTASAIAADPAVLAAYDSLVVSDVAYPSDLADDERSAYVDGLRSFAASGGQLVLTDGAVELAADTGVVDRSALLTGQSQAGHVVFGDKDHRWEAELRGLAEQTYYEVPLGYPSGSSTRRAPHHGVDTDAWAAAGGTTVATFRDDASFTALGEVPVGDGAVAIFGAVLPKQDEGEPHLFGLADYAVTVTGGQVLHSILEYRRPTGELVEVTGELTVAVGGGVGVGDVLPGEPPTTISTDQAREVLAAFWSRLTTALLTDGAR
ncbi:MAG: hypothetical protein KY461_06940 [Actinobacteria bacterium]|nr:hypothetical protein [Actinomycetota bacterium]